MADTDTIQEALTKLDVENNDHWTGDGLPKIDALGIPNLKRVDVTAVAPHFTRENPSLELPEEITSEPEQPEEAAATPEEDPDAAKLEETAAGQPVEEPAEAEKTFEGATPTIKPAAIQSATEAADERTELEKALKAADEKVQLKEKEIFEAQKVLRELLEARDKINTQLEQKYNSQSNQETIMDYIRKQNELRMQRALGTRQFMEQAGMGKQAALAPIDQAFINSRGKNRPQNRSVTPPEGLTGRPMKK